MNRQVLFLLSCNVALLARAAVAAPPEVQRVSPAALMPGQAVEVTFHGAGLSDVTQLWTSWPLEAEQVQAAGASQEEQEKQATFRIQIPATRQVGNLGARVVTQEGVSNLALLVVDTLPLVTQAEPNHSPETAQSVSFPAVVEGHCSQRQHDYYRIEATPGQTISLEAVARRIGSPLDPVLRILNTEGREVAFADDVEGLGPDCRLRHTFDKAGSYLLEIHDIRYEGGANHRYALRIGDFPLVSTPFPLGVRRGTTSEVEFHMEDAQQIPTARIEIPADTQATYQSIAASYPTGQGLTATRVALGDLPEYVELEPNQDFEQAVEFAPPAMLNGRFDQEKDRDCFRFNAKSGQQWRFVGMTRRFGSPADLFLRLYDSNGKLLKEVEDTGSEEGQLEYKFGADGTYCLAVEDLHWRGGAQLAYRVRVEQGGPRLRLTTDTDRLSVPQGGIAVIHVNAEREGFQEEIKLTPQGLPAGSAILSGDVLAANVKESDLRIRLPQDLESGSCFSVAIQGSAQVPGPAEGTTRAITATASSAVPVRESLSGLRYPPPDLTSHVMLGITPEWGPFFEVAAPEKTVLYPRLVGQASLEVKVTRSQGFQDPVTLELSGLPEGVEVSGGSVAKGQETATLQLQGPGLLAEGEYPLRLKARGTYKHQPQDVEIGGLVFKIVKPLKVVSAQPNGPLTSGGTQAIKIHLVRHGDQPCDARVEVLGLPPVVEVSPTTVTLDNTQNELELELRATPEAYAGSIPGITVAVEAEIAGKIVRARSQPFELEVRLP